MIYTVTFNPSLDYIVDVRIFRRDSSTGPAVKRSCRAERESMCRLF